ncbi:protein max-like isoform X3 [Macrobrachium rosenbergii]|uniref:protein max-like isoform X3 n=1 Tax=Macrobrachium rosenbergii TaxID=79674 RepID=UPI0034D39EB2
MPANALAKQIAKNSPLTQILMAGISTRVWTLSRHIDLSDRGNRIPSECRVAWERVFRMSDEERDIDIESDEEETCTLGPRGEIQFASQAEKRAHHNALERKRRDHIKDSFCSLRDSVPSLQGEKASRAQILKKAADYIEFMRRKNSAHQQDIDDLKKQNNLLESQTDDEDLRYCGKSKGEGQCHSCEQ